MTYAKYMQNEEKDLVDEIFRRISQLADRLTELENHVKTRSIHTHWFEPDLLNGVAQPDDPLDKFSYAIKTNGDPIFNGHLDMSGATSPVVAFTLPIQPGHITLSGDMYRHTVITPDDGSTFQLALVFIDSTSGDVTITWPWTP